MNLTTILTEVRDILGEDSEDFWKTTELTRYINEAQRRFAGANRWSWLLAEGSDTLTGGSSTLTLQDGVADYRHLNIMLTKVGDTRPYLPQPVTPVRGFQLRTTNYTPQSYPQWFYLASVADQGTGLMVSTIRFIPEPVDDLDVDYQYYRVVTDLSGGSAVPELPLQYHKALVHYAAGTAWLKELNGGAKAQEQFNLYDSVVAEAFTDEESNSDGTFLVAGGDDNGSVPGRSLTAAEYALSRIAPTLGS